uniref:VPS37 C-terminal domain-containing protein n=1 Tax=Oryza nivara TaxID=4536 RepID=A0A0E0GPV9_ORYNI
MQWFSGGFRFGLPSGPPYVPSPRPVPPPRTRKRSGGGTPRVEATGDSAAQRGGTPFLFSFHPHVRRGNRLTQVSAPIPVLPDCSSTMSWRFPLFGSQQQQPDTNFQDNPTQPWYPPSVLGSSSHPSLPSSSSGSPHQRASDNPQSLRGQPSPAEAAGIIARLKDKSVDDLQRLLKDKEAYNAFFNSLDQVKTQNNLRDELKKETVQLARDNLEKEQRILEIRNQCTIIRTTELAAAQDRLADLERQRDEVMKSYSPAALLDKLQKLMAKLDEESEELHQKFLEKDIDLPTFVQKHKKLRTAYHKQALLHLAGKTSSLDPVNYCEIRTRKGKDVEGGSSVPIEVGSEEEVNAEDAAPVAKEDQGHSEAIQDEDADHHQVNDPADDDGDEDDRESVVTSSSQDCEVNLEDIIGCATSSKPAGPKKRKLIERNPDYVLRELA